MQENTKLVIKAAPILLLSILLITLMSQQTTYDQEIEKLQNIITQQNTQIETLTTRVNQLETQLVQSYELTASTSLRVNDFSHPDYDSGWVPLEPGRNCCLTHNQGCHIFVYILGWDYTEDGGFAIHQNIIGDSNWSASSDESCGIRWYCDNEGHIMLCRGCDDCVWDEARVYIWKIEDTYQ